MTKGYLGTDNTIWDVSEPYTTYFFGEDKLVEDCEENWEEDGIRRSIEQGELGLASEEHDLKRVCLIFDSDELEFVCDRKLERDSSCGDEYSEFYQLSGKIPIELIKEIWIDTEKLDLLRMYFIGMVQDINEHRSFKIQGNFEELPEGILKASKKLYDDLSDFYVDNYVTIEVLEKKTLRKMLLEVFGKNSLERWIERD